jgi:hypothetical protein
MGIVIIMDQNEEEIVGNLHQPDHLIVGYSGEPEVNNLDDAFEI